MTRWSGKLREELCSRAAEHATRTAVVSYRSRGVPGVTLFPMAPDESAHGNFAPESFAAILGTPAWRRRLDKLHPQRKTALPAPYKETARELDSCTSSDALLMNVFCFPGVVSGRVAELLGVRAGSCPAFGVAGAVPLEDGSSDATELDMQLGDTNVEAKLTESDFTRRPIAHVERYADLYEVFVADALPRDRDDYLGYQLIRNVLAIARRRAARFRVILDARRPDLLREWWMLHGAIRDTDVRQRCGFVLWQEIAAVAPLRLRAFLAGKYGL